MKIILSIVVASCSFFHSTFPMHQETPQEQMRRILQYNPEVELIQDCTFNILNKDRVTIAVHGWGDSKDGIKALKQYYPEALPGCLIVYNCPDAATNNAPSLSKTSFGQELDIMPLLFILKQCVLQNYSTIDLNGHSRGAAVIINALATLNDKNGDNPIMAKLNMSTQEREKILSMIQNGCISLQCPLTNVRTAIKKQIDNISSGGFLSALMGYIPWGGTISEATQDSSATSVDYAASSVTYYKPWKEQAFTSAKKLVGLKLKILVHFEDNDHVVSNDNDESFFQALAQHNPEHVYMSKGFEGGHNRMSPCLYPILHAFKKKYGGAHDPQLAAQGHELFPK